MTNALRTWGLSLACLLWATTGCNLHHLRHRPPTLTAAGAKVALLDREATVPEACEYLRDTSTTSFQGDLRLKLVNNAAKYGGNVVHMRSSNRLMAEGAVYRCPDAVVPPGKTLATVFPIAAASAASAASEGGEDQTGGPSTVESGASNASLDAEARGIFMAGKAAYDDARYETALGHFKRAHELSSRPALLFNIGQAADKLRRDQEALDAFKAYLAQVPDGEGAREAESQVRILEQRLAQPAR